MKRYLPQLRAMDDPGKQNRVFIQDDDGGAAGRSFTNALDNWLVGNATIAIRAVTGTRNSPAGYVRSPATMP